MTELARIESREAFSVQWSSVDSKKSIVSNCSVADLFSAVVPGVWLVTLSAILPLLVSAESLESGDTAGLTIFFDKYIDGSQAIVDKPLQCLSKSQIARVDWDQFVEGFPDLEKLSLKFRLSIMTQPTSGNCFR